MLHREGDALPLCQWLRTRCGAAASLARRLLSMGQHAAAMGSSRPEVAWGTCSTPASCCHGATAREEAAAMASWVRVRVRVRVRVIFLRPEWCVIFLAAAW